MADSGQLQDGGQPYARKNVEGSQEHSATVAQESAKALDAAVENDVDHPQTLGSQVNDLPASQEVAKKSCLDSDTEAASEGNSTAHNETEQELCKSPAAPPPSVESAPRKLTKRQKRNTKVYSLPTLPPTPVSASSSHSARMNRDAKVQTMPLPPTPPSTPVVASVASQSQPVVRSEANWSANTAVLPSTAASGTVPAAPPPPLQSNQKDGLDELPPIPAFPSPPEGEEELLASDEEISLICSPAEQGVDFEKKKKIEEVPFVLSFCSSCLYSWCTLPLQKSPALTEPFLSSHAWMTADCV